MKKSKSVKFAMVLGLIICTLFLSIIQYKSGKNKRTIYSHRDEYHKIIHHLFDREIFENQLVGKILENFPPTKLSTHDNYLTLQYFESNDEVDDCCVYYSYYIHVIVKDNKLVKAFATEGLFSEIDYVFFNVLNESAEDAYWESRMKNAVATNNS